MKTTEDIIGNAVANAKKILQIVEQGNELCQAAEMAQDYLKKQWIEHKEPTVNDWDKLSTMLEYAIKRWKDA